ncbi:MAG: thymidylate kinase [Chloroflexi bacterium]|nr:thymidylate kinase [Chloroflexota bacterium]
MPLIALEGIDASGKATQTQLLIDQLRARDLRAAALSFPRYGETVFGAMIADYLNGKFGALATVAPQFAALLFAGDRLESRGLITQLAAESHVVVFDRYVASNLAHQAARVEVDQQRDFIAWLDQVEHGVYQLPRVDLTILLDVPVMLAAQMQITKRKRDYTDKPADLHEADLSYLQATSDVYNLLAAEDHGGRWQRIACVDADGQLRDPAIISAEIWASVAPFIEA